MNHFYLPTPTILHEPYRDSLVQKQEELARSLAHGFDCIITEAMQRKGYPLTEEYIRSHIAMRSPYTGLDRFFHNGKLFLEIVTEFDNSDPLKIKVNQKSFLY
ncbi:MAG TPA: hypothetical protein V6C63_21195 [Allocoleopsis sp.]